MAVGNIEAADDRALAVCNRHLLMVSQQVSLQQPRLELAEPASGLEQRLEEGSTGLEAAEIVDDERDGNAALRRSDQPVADLSPGVVAREGVEQQPEIALRGIDERNQPVEARGAVAQQFQSLVPRRAVRYQPVRIRCPDWVRKVVHRLRYDRRYFCLQQLSRIPVPGASRGGAFRSGR